jgi:hypothetical protein
MELVDRNGRNKLDLEDRNEKIRVQKRGYKRKGKAQGHEEVN